MMKRVSGDDLHNAGTICEGGKLWYSFSLQISRVRGLSSGFSLFAGAGRSASGRPSVLSSPSSFQRYSSGD